MSPTGLDVRVLEDLAVEYDRDLAATLVGLYQAELDARVSAIALGATRSAAGPSEVVRDAAHALASTSLTVGARRLGELCLELEQGWEDPDRVAVLVPLVVAESRVVADELDRRHAGSNR